MHFYCTMCAKKYILLRKIYFYQRQYEIYFVLREIISPYQCQGKIFFLLRKKNIIFFRIDWEIFEKKIRKWIIFLRFHRKNKSICEILKFPSIWKKFYFQGFTQKIFFPLSTPTILIFYFWLLWQRFGKKISLREIFFKTKLFLSSFLRHNIFATQKYFFDKTRKSSILNFSKMPAFFSRQKKK